MKALLGIRFVTVLAVGGALLGSILMFVSGAVETVSAWQVFLGLRPPEHAGDPSLDATVKVLTSLDSFMFGVVLLYFAFSIFFLFIRPAGTEAPVRIPKWLQVQGLEQMKRTMLEVIVVLLAVLLLIVGLENQAATELNWNLILLPVGILTIAGAIKLIAAER